MYIYSHSPSGTTNTFHLYSYSNNSDLADNNILVNNWAIGMSDHFQLLVPPAPQEGGGVKESTSREGPANKKCGAKGSPHTKLPVDGRLSADD